MKKLLALTVVGLTALPLAAHAQTAETPAPSTAPVAAAETETGPAPLEFITAQPSSSLFSSDLVGYSVYGAADEKIGDINDLLIDGNGAVEAVVIGVGGFIGIGEKDVAVPLGALQVSLADDRYEISIDATEEALEGAPAFARADGTSSDRLGAFERTFNRARNDAGEAIDAVSKKAEDLYDQATGAANEAAEEVKETADTVMNKTEDAAEDAKQAVQ